MREGDVDQPPSLSVRTPEKLKCSVASVHTNQRLTPPTTPIIHCEDKSEPDLDGNSYQSLERTTSANGENIISHHPHASNPKASQPLRFFYDLQTSQDGNGREIEYGRGAWSIVKQATSRWESPNPGVTPPPSPATASRLLAVKCPLRRDAHRILNAEARILTQITREAGSDEFVVPFYGYLPSSHSIVMAAIPLALSTFIDGRATTARQYMTTKSMFDPVIGQAQWKDLANRLIAGLSWLHNEAGVVHGDVKPQNILLRARRESERNADESNSTEDNIFPYDPLFADFSSAHDLSADSKDPVATASCNSFSALTPPYAAPELLSVAALKNPDTQVTTASDVFSMAATLLSAATGDLLLYPGSSGMQRLAMAREGHLILEFVRSGSNGSRVPRNGMVDTILKPAVKKDPAQRIDAAGWLRSLRPS